MTSLHLLSWSIITTIRDEQTKVRTCARFHKNHAGMKLKFSDESQILASSWMRGFPKQKFRPFLTVGPFASCQNASPTAWSVVVPTCGYWNPVSWTKERKSARKMWNPKEDLHSLTALPLHAPMDFLGSIFLWLTSLSLGRAIVLGWPYPLVESTAGRSGMVTVWLWLLAAHCHYERFWWDLELRFVVEDCRIPPNLGGHFES